MACTVQATIVLFLAAALTCCYAVMDRPGACKPWDIRVSVARTGKTVSGQPVYRVTIDNQCSCAQARVRVRCADGLLSVVPVDQSKIRAEDGGECLVNDGIPIARGSPVTFIYAWKEPQAFAITMAVPHC